MAPLRALRWLFPALFRPLGRFADKRVFAKGVGMGDIA